jgi:hypothetical protein
LAQRALPRPRNDGAAPWQPTNAIIAVEVSLIALAVGLSDRALIGFEEGLAEAFSNAPGFAGDMPALGLTPRRGTRPEERAKFIRFTPC